MAAKPTDNLEAYDFYLRGEEHFDKVWSSLNYQEAKYAVEMLEKAIELDPDFVAAYIWLSYIHSAVFTYGIDRSEERLKKAKAAVDKALEIRPEFPEANLCLAYYYFWGFLDHERALEIFESVQKVRPNVDLELKGKIQAAQGKFEEALESLEKAFKLDPRSPNDAMSIGHIYGNMRRYAEADAWYDRSLSLSPNNLSTLSVKVLNSVMWKGNTQEARSILEKFPSGPIADLLWIEMDIIDRNYAETLQQLESLSLNSFGIANIYVHKDLKYAAVHHRQHEFSLMKSHADSARKILEDLVQKYPEDPKYHSALGLAFAYLGRKEDAIREGNLATKLHPVSKDANRGPSTVRELTKILIIVGEYDIALDKLEYLMSIPAGRDVSVHTLKLHPRYDPLRDHPRFKRLLEKYSKDNS